MSDLAALESKFRRLAELRETRDIDKSTADASESAYREYEAELLETIDRPALKALPNVPYAYAEWQRARVAPDYHVQIAGHFYSVPSRLIREIVEMRITAETIEVFHKGKRIASHARSHLRHRHTTIPEHMRLLIVTIRGTRGPRSHGTNSTKL